MKAEPKTSPHLLIGIVGSVITAICCFTPLLTVVLGIAGLTALTAYLDVVLLPALAFFALITIFGLVNWRRNA